MENTINQRVKELRTFLGLSQQEFASRLDVGFVTISRIENDIANVSSKTMNSIIKTFGVSKDWLLKGIGEMEISEVKTIDSNPWKDALVSQLKDENSFLKEQLRTMRDLIGMIGGKKSESFLNGIGVAGIFGNKNFDNTVRVIS